MKLRPTFLLLLLFVPALLSGQGKPRKLTLSDVLEMARNQSRDALAAKNRFRSSYWAFRTYKANYMPMLTYDGTLPNLNRAITKITLPDGTEAFKAQSLANYSSGLSLTKNIGITGGQIFMNSDIQRIDYLSDTLPSSYLSSPLLIGLKQPVFGFNQLRWDRKIEPMKYEEARRKYLEDGEQIAISAVNDFFDLLLSQINMEIATVNQANYDTLYKIAQGRYNLGKIAENDLLQLELSLLNANANVESAGLDLEMNLFKLKSFLGIRNDEAIELIPPVETPGLTVDLQQALAQARSNRSDAVAFKRQLLESQSEVNRAKLENRFSANLYATYGLTQSATTFENAYKNPQDKQQVVFGLQIPILDWGLAKGKIRMAESNQDLVRTNVEQQQIDFDQEVYLQAKQFNMQQNQLLIAAKSDTVAQKRYEVAKGRYLIGKIGITDLNIAQTEKDGAKQQYVSTLRSFWRNFFLVRKLTLYDFLENKPLVFDMKVLK